MKTIIVTKENLNEFIPYQGTYKDLKLGDELEIVNDDVPCVNTKQGYKDTFSIVTDNTPSQNALDVAKLNNEEPKTNLWNLNRWSINNKFVK
jgi:hypothetical protein